MASTKCLALSCRAAISTITAVEGSGSRKCLAATDQRLTRGMGLLTATGAGMVYCACFKKAMVKQLAPVTSHSAMVVHKM